MAFYLEKAKEIYWFNDQFGIKLKSDRFKYIFYKLLNSFYIYSIRYIIYVHSESALTEESS